VTILLTFDHTIPPDTPIAVGVSGGVDSMVLLYNLQNHYPNISVLYFNHHWGDYGDRCEQLIRDYCQTHDIDLFVGHNTDPRQTETVARASRFEFFVQQTQELAISHLFLAHHGDDWAENFFIRFLRGSGLRGLFSLRQTQTYQHLTLHRPLLRCSKTQLVLFAQHHHIPFKNDPSNGDIQYKRNWIRSQLLPMLSTKAQKPVLLMLQELSEEVLYLTDTQEKYLLSLKPWLITIETELKIGFHVNHLLQLNQQERFHLYKSLFPYRPWGRREFDRIEEVIKDNKPRELPGKCRVICHKGELVIQSHVIV
jgi:tRNA(Ile)-lysidine synthetase-like protein